MNTVHPIGVIMQLQMCRGAWLVRAILAVAILLAMATASRGAPSAAFDHSTWDQILKTYVDDDGLVAYDQLRERDQANLDAYMGRLAGATPESWDEPEQVAFWINAYNAGIVAAILQGYSPESTLSRMKLFRWYSSAVAGKKRTPDEIEHEILRKQFREPRIHFALVCAATSCPKLRREAYRGDVLDSQLDEQARQFINDPTRNRIDLQSGLRLSTIFQWFEDDFLAGGMSIPEFVARYVEDPRKAEFAKQFKGTIQYLDYDWTLNAQTDATNGRDRSSTEDSNPSSLLKNGSRAANGLLAPWLRCDILNKSHDFASGVAPCPGTTILVFALATVCQRTASDHGACLLKNRHAAEHTGECTGGLNG